MTVEETLHDIKKILKTLLIFQLDKKLYTCTNENKGFLYQNCINSWIPNQMILQIFSYSLRFLHNPTTDKAQWQNFTRSQTPKRTSKENSNRNVHFLPLRKFYNSYLANQMRRWVSLSQWTVVKSMKSPPEKKRSSSG